MTDATLSPGQRADRAVVRRAAASIAVRIGVVMALVFVAVGALAIALLTRVSAVERDEHLALAARGNLDFDHIEDNRVLIEQGPHGRRVSLGAPADVAAIDPTALPPGASTVPLGEDRRAHVYVVQRDDELVAAAVLDTRSGRAMLLSWSPWIAVGVAGTLATAGAAWWIARRSVAPLAEALAAQRRFVADASHELRTPLTVVTTRAQLARRHLAQGRDATADLDRLVRDGHVLTDVLDDLLLSTQLGAATRPGEPVDLAALVADVVSSLRPAAHERGVELRYEGAGPAPVNGVPGALRRAVTALADNAVTHSPSQGVVVVGVAAGPRWATITVTDQGPGLDPADLGPLTRRFARGGAPDPAGREGLRHAGLGLALVREVADAHRGVLEFARAPAGGAAVTLRIPRSS